MRMTASVFTQDPALAAWSADGLRVQILVSESDRVAQRKRARRLRHQPGIVMTAPMPGEVAETARAGNDCQLSGSYASAEPDGRRTPPAQDLPSRAPCASCWKRRDPGQSRRS